MSLFKFEIDRGASFLYWAQYMINWIWYNKNNNKKYYLDIIGRNLNEKEIESLNKLSKVLKKDGNGYLWLWDIYSGNDNKEWDEIKNNLEPAFEKIWDGEYPKLVKWQKKLDKIFTENDFLKIFNAIKTFFGSNVEIPVKIKLHISSSNDSAIGATKKEFSNFIILGVSALENNYTHKAMSTIFHELSHFVMNKSEKEKLIEDKFIENKNKFNKFKNGPSWRHLFIESIIYMIAGRNFSYFVKEMSPNVYMKMSDKDELEKFKYDKENNDYIFHAKSVAYKMRNVMLNYLSEEREMDKEFASKLINTWVEFINK